MRRKNVFTKPPTICHIHDGMTECVVETETATALNKLLFIHEMARTICRYGWIVLELDALMQRHVPH